MPRNRLIFLLDNIQTVSSKDNDTLRKRIKLKF